MNDDASFECELRAAQSHESERILAFLDPFVQQRLILPRTPAEIQKLAENGFIATCDHTIAGFAAVEPYSRKLAELQCLAVAEPYRRRGVGRRLIQACIQRARQLGVYELMAITAIEEPFRDCGFDYALPQQKRALFIHPQMVDHPMEPGS